MITTHLQWQVIRDLKVSEAIKQTAVKVINDWNGKQILTTKILK